MSETLRKRLLSGDEPIFGYPMSPTKAAALIVAELLSDLPKARQDTVRAIIEEWASERESAVAITVYESSGER